MQPRKAIAGHRADAQDGLWTRYVTHTQAQGVTPTVVRWYVIRAEQYIRSVAQQRLEDHTPQDVTTYLEQLGRRGGMTDWQYRQTVEAIQQGFRIAEVAWALQFDWAYWKASARTLPTTHPTIAREVAPTTPTEHTASTQTQSERPVTRRAPTVGMATGTDRGNSTPRLLHPHRTGLCALGKPVSHVLRPCRPT